MAMPALHPASRFPRAGTPAPTAHQPRKPVAVIDGDEIDLDAEIARDLALAKAIIESLTDHSKQCESCSDECRRWVRDQWSALTEILGTARIAMRSRAERCDIYIYDRGLKN